MIKRNIHHKGISFNLIKSFLRMHISSVLFHINPIQHVDPFGLQFIKYVYIKRWLAPLERLFVDNKNT